MVINESECDSQPNEEAECSKRNNLQPLYCTTTAAAIGNCRSAAIAATVSDKTVCVCKESK